MDNNQRENRMMRAGECSCRGDRVRPGMNPTRENSGTGRCGCNSNRNDSGSCNGSYNGRGNGNGNCNCNTARRSPLMQRLQELDFAMIDTGLYLDMNPTCREALAHYQRLSEERERVKCEYERQYGPITIYGAGRDCEKWNWIEQPWPWENETARQGGCC